jgi:hypothetical protein
MIYKFVVQQYNDNGDLIKEKDMKTLKEISGMLNIEYHQARQLYLLCKGITKKPHPFLKELSKTIKIIDKKRIINDLN